MADIGEILFKICCGLCFVSDMVAIVNGGIVVTSLAISAKILKPHDTRILYTTSQWFLPVGWYPFVSADGSSTRRVLSDCWESGRLMVFQSDMWDGILWLSNWRSGYGFLSENSMGLGRWILRSSVRSSEKQ